MEHECALLGLGKTVESLDDVEVTHSWSGRHNGVRRERDKTSATLLTPMVSYEVVQHPTRPTLGILVLAYPGPLCQARKSTSWTRSRESSTSPVKRKAWLISDRFETPKNRS